MTSACGNLIAGEGELSQLHVQHGLIYTYGDSTGALCAAPPTAAVHLKQKIYVLHSCQRSPGSLSLLYFCLY